MANMNCELSAEEVREILSYDPESGLLRWKINRGPNAKAGNIAGSLATYSSGKSYYSIRIFYKLYLAHRIIWLITHGRMPEQGKEIDHINGVSTDNRIENLREVTHSQNMMNRGRASHNKSGFKGVSWDSVNNKWVARIRVPSGKYKSLGRFDTPEKAHNEYCLAASTLFGDFFRPN